MCVYFVVIKETLLVYKFIIILLVYLPTNNIYKLNI